MTREIAGETIIVPLHAHVGDLNSIYTLNEVGTMIWKFIDGKTSVPQIVEAICDAYDVAQRDAEKDAIEFLGSLKSAGLIRASEKDKRSAKGP